MDGELKTIMPTSVIEQVMLDVPFLAQYANDVPAEWQKRVCGIVSLRMALLYLLRTEISAVPSAAELIHEAEVIKGWSPYGLSHDAVVRMAHNHGVAAYREEFRSVAIDHISNETVEGPLAAQVALYGLRKLHDALRAGYVPIVSVTVDGKSDTHLVPLIGFNADGWYYHDPAEYDASPGAQVFISNTEFERRFRKLVIFIGPVATSL